ASVTVTANDVQTLRLTTLDGSDQITTVPLRRTRQQLTAGTDATLSPDTLIVNAGGVCLRDRGGVIDVAGRPSISYTDFDTVVANDVCCSPDPCAGAVATMGCTVNGVRDQLCQGTDGDDVIVGTKGSDVILGGEGNDRIKGGAGDDLLCGAGGDDVLFGGRGN